MERQRLKQLIAGLAERNTPLLQILLAVQDANSENYISEENIQDISEALKVSRCRVYSTATFYDEISLRPRGRNIIRVCSNAPCQNAGKDRILEALKELLQIELGETTGDRRFTLESVSCLGGCYMSPAIKINDRVFGNLAPEDIPGIIAGCKEWINDEAV